MSVFSTVARHLFCPERTSSSTIRRVLFSTTMLDPPSFSRTFPEHLPNTFQALTLTQSKTCATDHKILRFQLPTNVPNVSSLNVPTGIKIRQLISGQVLDKSYSPISNIDANGFMDVLVKQYPFQQGGGLGKHLYDMKVGDVVDIKLKPTKLFKGTPYVPNRWQHLVLVGNGTGVAPMYQLAQHILHDPQETTKITMISQHRSEVLMQQELDAMSAAFPERFRHHSLLSQPVVNEGHTDDGHGVGVGRLGLKHLMDPTILNSMKESTNANNHCIVCGTDQFLESICGNIVRIDVGGKKLKKQQGPLLGLLKEAGWSKEQVTKL